MIMRLKLITSNNITRLDIIVVGTPRNTRVVSVLQTYNVANVRSCPR